MENVIHLAVNWAVPVILTAVLTYMKKVINDNKTMKTSMLSLIRSQIVSMCESYQEVGYLPEYARYCLEELYKNYKILGGNHGIEVLVNKTYELPLRKDTK